MTLNACAALVARADPDRWAAVLAAPQPARAPLIVLFAYNIEVSRAPWASTQELIAQMRLQWWRDVLVDPAPKAHDVASPLQDLLAKGKVDASLLDAMAAARVWDVYSDPFDTMQQFTRYIDHTAGGLAAACAMALGGDARAADVARAYGQAQGMANFLRAVPDLRARGRRPLIDDQDSAIAALAAQGLAALQRARSHRRDLGGAWPAVLACAQAGAILHKAAQSPHLVRQGGLTLAPARARARLIWASLTRRV